MDTVGIEPSAANSTLKEVFQVGSPHGGNTAAILFSLLDSCKRHDIEPWAYLRDVLQRLAMPCSPEELRQLFPHRWLEAKPRHEVTGFTGRFR